MAITAPSQPGLLATRRFYRCGRATLSAMARRGGSALVRRPLSRLCCSAFFSALSNSRGFYNQQLVVSGLRDAARYMTDRTHRRQPRPCAKGSIHPTRDAANIATTAPATGGSARVTVWSAADITIAALRALRSRRKLRRWLDKHDDNRRCDPSPIHARAFCLWD